MLTNTNDLTKILNKNGSLRYSPHEILIQELAEYFSRNNAMNITGISIKEISKIGNLIKSITDDFSKPERGIYQFTKIATNQINITKDNISLGNFSYTDNIVKQQNFVILISELSEIGDTSTYVVNNGVKYKGGEIAYNGSSLSYSASSIQFKGFTTDVVGFSESITIPNNNTRIVVLKLEEKEITYNDLPSVLGIPVGASYYENSPSANQVQKTFETYTNFVLIPDDTDTITYIILGYVEVDNNGVVTIYNSLDDVKNILQNKNVIHKYFTETQIRRLVNLSQNLQIDMDDGKGLRKILTEKIPSKPNTVDSIQTTVTPITYVLDSNIIQNLRSRDTEKSNVSSLSTQYTLLKQLETLATVKESKDADVVAKIQACFDGGAITQDQYDYLIAPTTTIEMVRSAVPNYISSKDNERKASEENLQTYEKNIYEKTKTVNPDVEKVTGILKINWDEPELVDNEDIIGYRIKIFKMTDNFTDTTQDLKDKNLTTPKSLANSTEEKQYITEELRLKDSDKKRRTVENNQIVFIDDTDVTTYDITVKTDEKMVIYLASISEYDIISDWSDPFVIDIPEIIVDPNTGQKFKDYKDDRNKVSDIKRDITVSEQNRELNNKIEQLQVAIDGKLDLSTYNESR